MMHGRKRILVAMVGAMAAFAASGGIQASEKAIDAIKAQSPGVESSIRFANAGGISNWQADGDRALYVQDIRGRWYRAALLGPCHDLGSTEGIAFLTRGPDTLDKFSAIQVGDQRCQFTSLATSDGPPRRPKKAAGGNPG